MASVFTSIWRGVLPNVVAKRFERIDELRAIGSSAAFRTAFYPSLWSEYLSSNLGLLPSGTLRTLHTVVDVGANIGAWSRAVLMHSSVGKLLAIEPNPDIFPILERTLSGPRVRCMNIAVGSSKAKLSLHKTRGNTCSSLLSPNASVNAWYGDAMAVAGTVPVDVERLDDVLASEPRISLLKVDVQGYEREVLRGAEETLRKTDWILIEANFVSHYENDILFTELNGLLHDAGFSVSSIAQCFRKSGRALWTDVLYQKGS